MPFTTLKCPMRAAGPMLNCVQPISERPMRAPAPNEYPQNTRKSQRRSGHGRTT